MYTPRPPSDFNRRAGRDYGQNAAEILDRRLVLLQDLLYCRLHGNVQQTIGMDSMLMPVSELKTQLAAKTEMAVYQVAESRAAAGELGLDAAPDNWFSRWLGRLLLGEAIDANALARLADYDSKAPRERLLAFTDVLTHVLPESPKARWCCSICIRSPCGSPPPSPWAIASAQAEWASSN